MSVTVKHPTKYKAELWRKTIDLDSDTLKVLLMRQGFAFDENKHQLLKNIKGTTGVTTLNFVATTKKITRAAGSFITDGFVSGNKVTCAGSASNAGPFTIVSVADLEIVVSETVVDESGSGDENLTANDELATGNGYTQDTKTTGTVTITEDTSNKRADATYPTVRWTAAGGSIGPTPGAIVYDDTHADNIVIQYINFGGDKTEINGNNFDIGGGLFRNS